MTNERTGFDCILAGGGLANGLLALRLKALRPTLAIAIVDGGDRIGGNHTWSFHEGDLAPAVRRWIEPLVAHAWPVQEVRFGHRVRVLGTGYASVTSARLDKAVRSGLGEGVHLNARVSDIGPRHVTLADGRQLTAPLVVDGRGALPSQPMVMRFQKFIGLEVVTRGPHGLSWPLLMDARVHQSDGFRFVYTLPLGPDRLLIEDTYYSDDATLDAAAIEAGIYAYAATQGWTVAQELRREQGVLAIPLAGDIDGHWSSLGREVPRVGLRAWMFHATTGYSLPQSAALADEIAQAPDLTSAAVAALVEHRSRANWEEQTYCRMLNRLLFLAARPEQRVTVMKRFYTLPEGMISRFYAGKPTRYDKMRILSGWPPVSVFRAIESLPEAAAWNPAPAARSGT